MITAITVEFSLKRHALMTIYPSAFGSLRTLLVDYHLLALVEVHV